MKNCIFLTYFISLMVGLSFSVQAADVVNVSARSSVGSGEETFFASFVVVGEPGELTAVLALGSGPTENIENPIADPIITLFQVLAGQNSVAIESNDNWKEGAQMYALTSTGIPPSLDLSSGMIAWVEPGAYSLALADNTGNGGIGVAEIYEMVFKDIPNSLMDATGLDIQVSALQAATPNTDVMALLSGEGPFTIFVSRNEAFADISSGQLEAELANAAVMADRMLYTIFEGELTAADITNSQIIMANGEKATLWVNKDGSIIFQGAQVIESDFIATNGVIHVVDEYDFVPASDVTLGFALTEVGNFDTLVDLALSVDANEPNTDPGPWTVFAPTDDAWAALPESFVDSLTIQQKQSILAYIGISGTAIEAASLTTGPLNTEPGLDLNIVVSEAGITVNGANVILPDIIGSNGVIHALDAVPLPPGL